MKPLEFIRELNNRGVWSFTFQDARDNLGADPTAAIRILRRKGRIIDPGRGYYIIIPEDSSLSGRLQPEWYIDGFMNHFRVPYYVSLLTAASFHGAAHQSPQVFQVMTYPARRNILVNQNKIVFYRNKNIELIPTDPRKTVTGYFQLSTPEITFFDLVEYNRRIGGLDHVALVTSELAEGFSKKVLNQAATNYPTPVVQRSGYLLDILDFNELASVLSRYIHKINPIYTYLDPSGVRNRETKNTRWKIIINEEIDIDI